MCCGVEVHHHLIIPFGQFLTHKSINSIHSEALMNSRKVIFIVINESLVDPLHVTNYGLLV